MHELLSALADIFSEFPAAWIATVVVLGLLFGSFLNVVIHRLPIMLDREWRAQANDILASPALSGAPAADAKYTLVTPRSACTKCGAMITAAQNIPIVSYLFQRGKCARCGERISLRYPIVELATALLSAAVAVRFGFSWFTMAALVLTWMLVAMSVIDFDHQILPDNMTLPLLWLGLIVSLIGGTTNGTLPVDLRSSVIGAIAGYVSLWSVYWLFKLITGKEGMGFGDFKLFGALGAWMGWQMLPLIIVLSAFTGAVVGIALILFRGRDRNIPIPFGPYLAAAGWIALIWGNDIVHVYLHTVGMRAD